MTYDYPDKTIETDEFCQPGLVNLRRLMLHYEPTFVDLGCYSNRNIRNSDQLSVHAVGRAIDIGCDPASPQSKASLDICCAALARHGVKFGIQLIIFDRRAWSQKNGWREYTGPAGPHTTHAHIEVTRWGATEGPFVTEPTEIPDQNTEEDEMTPEDYKGIAEAIMTFPITTRYRNENGTSYEVEFSPAQFFANAQILLDRLVAAVEHASE